MSRPEGVESVNCAQIDHSRDRWSEARAADGRDLSRVAGILIEIAGRLIGESSEEHDEHHRRLRQGLDRGPGGVLP